MANPWLRLYAEFAKDAKVQSMPEHMQRRLIMLLCLRCSNELVTLHETELAFALHVSETELSETKALFIAKKFIDEGWNLLNWDKRQFASDSSNSRVRKHRDKKKQSCNVTVTPPDTDTDTDNKESKDSLLNAQPVAQTSEKRKAQPLAKPSGVDAQTWKDWQELRRRKSAPVTQTAIDGIAREAQAAGISLNTALQACCANGWQGFKADWYARDKPLRLAHAQPENSATAAFARAT